MAIDRALPPEYVVQHVREALANDERVGQLDIGVTVAGERIQLAGCVQTPDRRRAILDVVGEIAPDWDIHNAIVVEELHETEAVENLP
jgi:osmotically-inducible protein OsmY